MTERGWEEDGGRAKEEPATVATASVSLTARLTEGEGRRGEATKDGAKRI